MNAEKVSVFLFNTLEIQKQLPLALGHSGNTSAALENLLQKSSKSKNMKTLTEQKPFTHISDIKMEYYSRKPDGHFFDPQSMRFFKSRIGAIIGQNEKAVYFLTSEQGPSGKRRYTARVMDTDGEIECVGKFNVCTRPRAIQLADQAKQEQFTAKELSNGGCAIGCILDAKKFWEEDGGTLSDRCTKMRHNAEHWAERAGWRIEWTSITPHIHRAGREYQLASILPFID